MFLLAFWLRLTLIPRLFRFLAMFPSRACGAGFRKQHVELDPLIRYESIRRWGDKSSVMLNLGCKICRRCCTPRCRVLAEPCLTVVNTPRQGFQLPPLAFGVQSSQRPCQLIGNCLLRHVSQVAHWKWRNTDVFVITSQHPNWHPIRGKSPNTTGVADSRALFRMVSP